MITIPSVHSKPASKILNNAQLQQQQYREARKVLSGHDEVNIVSSKKVGLTSKGKDMDVKVANFVDSGEEEIKSVADVYLES